jgi:hypothetical protein
MHQPNLWTLLIAYSRAIRVVERAHAATFEAIDNADDAGTDPRESQPAIDAWAKIDDSAAQAARLVYVKAAQEQGFSTDRLGKRFGELHAQEHNLRCERVALWRRMASDEEQALEDAVWMAGEPREVA